ncbi:MAG: response regulator [Acidimicrobiia bacterium]
MIQTVLLVDDDPAIRVLGEMSFTAVGRWRTVVASSGFEALSLASRIPVDVIVLDMEMPGLDGLATLRQLRLAPQTANTPIVFLTASVTRHDVARYLEAGADGVIAKPFHPMTLPQHLQRVVDGEVCVA